MGKAQPDGQVQRRGGDGGGEKANEQVETTSQRRRCLN